MKYYIGEGEKMGYIIENQSLEQIKKIIEKENVNILYFGANTCSVCHAVFPKLMEILKEYSIPILKVDSHKCLDISGQFVVFTMPTILIFHKGEEILRESRFINFNNIKRTLALIIDRENY